MTTKKRFTIVQENKIAELYTKKHLTTTAIAKIYKCTHSTIALTLKRKGIEGRNRNRVYLSDSTVTRLSTDYLSKGFTQKDIARKYKIAMGTVIKLLKLHGIRKRTQSEASTLAHKRGSYKPSYLSGKHSSKLEQAFLKYVEETLQITLDRNEYGQTTHFANGYYFDARYKNTFIEVDGKVHKVFRKDNEWYNYHKRLQAAEDVGCRVVRIPLDRISKPCFERGVALLKPYVS